MRYWGIRDDVTGELIVGTKMSSILQAVQDKHEAGHKVICIPSATAKMMYTWLKG